MLAKDCTNFADRAAITDIGDERNVGTGAGGNAIDRADDRIGRLVRVRMSGL